MKILITLFLGYISVFSPPPENLLNQIKEGGELVVATRNGPSTYYEGPAGPAGLEYDLAKRFADELRVRLRVVAPDKVTDILPMVANNRVHFAAAGLRVTDERKAQVRFGPGYQYITTHIVYRKGTPRPRKKGPRAKSKTGCMDVALGMDHLEDLKRLREAYPHFTWQEYHHENSVELLEQVQEQLVDYSVVNSDELRQAQRFNPELQKSFDISGKLPLAWAFPRLTRDDSLYLAAIRFFNRIEQSGELAQLIDRYYGHIETFNYVDIRTFHRHIEERLPAYRYHFEKVARQYQLDWRLLAAIGYQESLWNPKAVSPTGVRGLMMLTTGTAKDMGVKNRRDPFESIAGGGKYFAKIYERIPDEIKEPDRTWLALASYNVGFGHFIDARKLALKHGDNPNHWVDVKKYLLLLSKPRWYTQTKHGYARGYEAVHYVKRIRDFYDILTGNSEREIALEKPSDAPEALFIEPTAL
ncbi:MAG: membrane-bound lytic murein transglycosylase MltF [Gammaproteobacteria bacterium]|nr:membrane-bound lytic murein transglycosylase MltF [Gammaproteobacteria bacterium]